MEIGFLMEDSVNVKSTANKPEKRQKQKQEPIEAKEIELRWKKIHRIRFKF